MKHTNLRLQKNLEDSGTTRFLIQNLVNAWKTCNFAKKSISTHYERISFKVRMQPKPEAIEDFHGGGRTPN